MKHNSSILVVDDSGTNLFLLERLLEDEGYQVIAIDNAREALDYLKKKNNIQLILLDIMMPGIDGFEFMDKLSEEPSLKEIPVVMVTAKNDQASQKKALSMGAVGFMAKPLDLNKLRNLIREHLSR
ncbi:MAG TPA: response regulator [Bacteroidales bacterium]|nr:response regulator [Bacteroidales bacterium]